MAIYVDDANIPATVPNGRARHTSQWSHLFADTQEELHEFSAKLGLRRSYSSRGGRVAMARRRRTGITTSQWASASRRSALAPSP